MRKKKVVITQADIDYYSQVDTEYKCLQMLKKRIKKLEKSTHEDAWLIWKLHERIHDLERERELIASSCGIPDAAQACRTILSIIKGKARK